MYFFLLLAIPSVSACILLTDSRYTFKQLSVPLFGGLFSGIITALVREFFINSEYFQSANFAPAMIHYIPATIIPALVITALIYFFAKDDLEYKAYAVFPALAFFYSVFIPYQAFTQGEPESLFHSFANPLLFIETILLFCSAVRFATFAYDKKDRRTIIIASIAAVACLLIEPALSALWYLKSSSFICGISTAVLAPFSILVYKFSLK